MKVYVDFKNGIVCGEYDYLKILRNSAKFQEYFQNAWAEVCELDENEIEKIDNFEDLKINDFEREEIINTCCRNYLHYYCEQFEIEVF